MPPDTLASPFAVAERDALQKGRLHLGEGTVQPGLPGLGRASLPVVSQLTPFQWATLQPYFTWRLKTGGSTSSKVAGAQPGGQPGFSHHVAWVRLRKSLHLQTRAVQVHGAPSVRGHDSRTRVFVVHRTQITCSAIAGWMPQPVQVLRTWARLSRVCQVPRP